MLHQTDRKVNSENDISRILTTPPDFTQTQSILEKKKEAAYAYLKTCLSF
jgi:hypothetical protein